jgi:hypothetical protein
MPTNTANLALNIFSSDEYFNVEQFNNENMRKIDTFAGSIAPAGNPPINSQEYDRTPAPVSTVSGDATSITSTVTGWTGSSDMSVINIKLAQDIGEAATLNVNGLGAVPIYKNNGNQPSAGEYKAGAILTLILNTSNNRFYVIGDGGNKTILPIGNVVYKGTVASTSNLPTSGMSQGDYYFVGNRAFALYTGTAFVTLTIPNVPNIYVQSSQPTSPKTNDLWFW